VCQRRGHLLTVDTARHVRELLPALRFHFRATQLRDVGPHEHGAPST
jgi:hypothetical protein